MSAKPWSLSALGSAPDGAGAVVVVGVLCVCAVVCRGVVDDVLAAAVRCFLALVDAVGVLALVRPAFEPPPVTAIAATAPATSSSAASATTAGQRRARAVATGCHGGGVAGR